MKSLKAQHCGAVLIELAILLPLLVILLASIIEIGNALMQFHAINKSAMDAGRFLSNNAKAANGTYSLTGNYQGYNGIKCAGNVGLTAAAQNLVNCGLPCGCGTKAFFPGTVTVGGSVNSTGGLITLNATYNYRPLITGTILRMVSMNTSLFTFYSQIVIQTL